MVNDILVILMMAFGIFAIVMFILFYVYLKKHNYNKHINDDYDIGDIEEIKEEKNIDEEEYIPKKKK